MLFYEPDKRDRSLLPHDPFKAVVAPRPIGWVSTLGPDGELNLAPYSFFNAVGENPPMLGFSSNGRKHSASFAHAGGEFVWNMPTWDLREQMNLSSATLPHGESEWDFAGLETAPSTLVAPPRVAASPVALECKVVHAVEFNDVDGNPADQFFTVGQVVGVHIDERFIGEDGIVDYVAMRPIARCGYRADYTVLDSLFHMVRPQ
jgi:flavin reductase (DIM6/NTAB) family NADH-FMN oxidoreductase RutF